MSKGFDNPLMPRAKLRQIYTAMVRARAVWKALPPRLRNAAYTFGLEACLVSTSVDLGRGDLVSETVSGAAVDFLRGATLRAVLRPKAAKGRGKVVADCGAAGRLPAMPGVAERLWAALGAAAALKAAAEVAKSAEATETKTPAGVVVAYLRAGEAKPALLRQVLESAAKLELPIVFVVMPPEAGAKVSGVSMQSQGWGVPGIAVDGDDAVAIYRVAQESIGRARMGGGAALIECVPFVVKGAAEPEDAILGLEGYLLLRGVATRAWMDRVGMGFSERVKAAKSEKG